MVDTVRLEFPPAPWRNQPLDGWDESHIRSTHRGVGAPGQERHSEGRRMKYRALGLRVGGGLAGARWVEVSVPRLLHGSNVVLVESDEELSRARGILNELVSQVCECDLLSSGVLVSRLDLVVYIQCPVKDVIAAHRATRHPKFRKGAGVFVGQSLVYRGRSRCCRFYDKAVEQKHGSSNETRGEWQLRPRALVADFGAMVPWASLRLADCYRVLRSLCLGFQPSAVPKGGTTIYDFFAMLECEEVTIRSVPVVDLYLKGLKPSSVNRVRKEIAKRRPAVMGFNWDKLLPPDFEAYLAIRPNGGKEGISPRK